MITHYFAPSSDTSVQRSTRLARLLAERGEPPTVVTAAPEFYGGEVFPGPSLRDDLGVVEVPWRRRYGVLRALGAPGRWARNLLLQRAYRRAIERALAERPRPDFVYWWGHPFWYFPLAAGLRRQTGIPCVLDFVDVWYMGGVSYRRGARTGPRKLIDRRAEAASVRAADLVLLTTDAQARLYRERYPDRADRIMTVRWGCDADALRDVAPAPKPEGLFRICILGRFSVYRAEDAAALAAAVSAGAAEREIEVVHAGAQEPALEAAFARAGVGDRLRCLGMVPYGEALGWLASADCAAANPLSAVSIPVKVYDYVRLNVPMFAFAPAGSAMEELLRPLPGALVVESADEATAALGRVLSGEVMELQPGLDPAPYSQQYQFERMLERLDDIRTRRRQNETRIATDEHG
jgi:glycosyltransferase involved in cell wall biosynthesis